VQRAPTSDGIVSQNCGSGSEWPRSRF
jgi:hypothetical protein